jgi:hypothetical protein
VPAFGLATNLGFVSSFHRFTMAKEAEFHEIDPDFMKSAWISWISLKRWNNETTKSDLGPGCYFIVSRNGWNDEIIGKRLWVRCPISILTLTAQVNHLIKRRGAMLTVLRKHEKKLTICKEEIHPRDFTAHADVIYGNLLGKRLEPAMPHGQPCAGFCAAASARFS